MKLVNQVEQKLMCILLLVASIHTKQPPHQRLHMKTGDEISMETPLLVKRSMWQNECAKPRVVNLVKHVRTPTLGV